MKIFNRFEKQALSRFYTLPLQCKKVLGNSICSSLAPEGHNYLSNCALQVAKHGFENKKTPSPFINKLQ